MCVISLLCGPRPIYGYFIGSNVSAFLLWYIIQRKPFTLHQETAINWPFIGYQNDSLFFSFNSFYFRRISNFYARMPMLVFRAWATCDSVMVSYYHPEATQGRPGLMILR